VCVPPEPDAELDIRHLFGVLWRRAWLVLLLVVVGAVGGYLYSARQPSLYAATSQVQIRDPNAGLLGISGQASNAVSATREVANQLEFIRSTEVRVRANELLGDTGQPVVSMSATEVSGTDLVNIRVVSRSPEVAQAGANAFADAYVERRKEQLQAAFATAAADLRAASQERTAQAAAIDARLAPDAENLTPAQRDSLALERDALIRESSDLNSQANENDQIATGRTAGIIVIEQASLPRSPFEPTPLRTAGVGAVLGLVLGIGLVFLLERLDDRVSSVEQVEQLTGGLPVLGTIPVHAGSRRWGRHKLPHGERVLVPPGSLSAEAYRTLQTSIRFSSLGKTKQTLLLTSSVSGEGKSTCAANLAAMLADSGLRVVVISADLRKPALAPIFGVDDTTKGLTSVLLGDATLAEVLVPVTLETGRTVYVLPAGPLPHNPTELLGSQAFGAVLREIEDAGADFVLVDCAPVLPVSDPLAAAQHVDGVLVMTVVGESKRSNLTETVARLRQVQADVVGVVLNGVSAKGYGYGGYGYSYGYGRPQPQAGASVVPADPTGGAPAAGAAGPGADTNGYGAANGAPGANGAGGTHVPPAPPATPEHTQGTA
jgi:capsular exopolysaccharide synthesis family protein